MIKSNYKVFLSGGMSGYPLYNFNAFIGVYEPKLLDMGYSYVVNPAREALRRYGAELFNEEWVLRNFNYEEMMCWCLSAVADCDFIALMPDWNLSNGSKREVERALSLHKGVIVL